MTPVSTRAVASLPAWIGVAGLDESPGPVCFRFAAGWSSCSLADWRGSPEHWAGFPASHSGVAAVSLRAGSPVEDWPQEYSALAAVVAVPAEDSPRACSVVPDLAAAPAEDSLQEYSSDALALPAAAPSEDWPLGCSNAQAEIADVQAQPTEDAEPRGSGGSPADHSAGYSQAC